MQPRSGEVTAMKSVLAACLVGALIAPLSSGCRAIDDGAASASSAANLDGNGATEPYLFVTDVHALEAIEPRNHGLHDAFGASGPSGAELFASSAKYRSIEAMIEADIAFAIDDQTAHGRTPVGHGDGASSALARLNYRTFNPDWLKSPEVHYELVGDPGCRDAPSGSPISLLRIPSVVSIRENGSMRFTKIPL
jgi:hypothetical protein